MSDIQILCRNLKYLRKTRRLTRREMAKILSIPLRDWRKLERGILPDTVTVETLYRIQTHFGIHPKNQFTPLF